MTQHKYKYLLKNIGLLTISNFGTKLLSFFLVPLYTSILSTADYGTYDLYNTTIGLLIPILTVNIQESVLRFSLGENKDKEAQIFSYGVQLTGISSLIIAAFVCINQAVGGFKIITDYPIYFLLMYVSTAFYNVMSNFARGIDRIADVSIAGIFSSLAGFGLNVLLLVYVKIGLDGYFIASIASAVVPCIYLAVRTKLHQYLVFHAIDKQIKHDMIAYSAPLVLNAIGWWINNASDRYIVTWFCGVDVNGVYSVGYKIPAILNVFQTIFNQAWLLSSVREFDSEDKDGFFAKIYSIYNFLMVFVCAFIIIFTRFIANILYAKDFYSAWQYVPFLTISIVFGAVSGVIGGVFAAAKDSKIFSYSTLLGGAVNTGLNFLLVWRIGAIGAAIATAISYAVVWIVRLRYVKSHMELNIYLGRDIVGYCLLLVMTGLLFMFKESIIYYALECALFLILLLLYRQEMRGVLNRVKPRFKR